MNTREKILGALKVPIGEPNLVKQYTVNGSQTIIKTIV